MFVRELKRKIIKNISVQIVESYRNEQGQPRLRIVRHRGSIPPDVIPQYSRQFMDRTGTIEFMGNQLSDPRNLDPGAIETVVVPGAVVVHSGVGWSVGRAGEHGCLAGCSKHPQTRG
ncbi:MAG: hypothetical protein OXF48_05110 [Bacteroidetes bacterium]|nr:hypothetical protein [Bacteroidota bacterium]